MVDDPSQLSSGDADFVNAVKAQALNMGALTQAFGSLSTSIMTGFHALSNDSYINRIRNGSFGVAQRGTSGTVNAGTFAYTLDGWIIGPVGANVSWSQVYNTNLAGYALRINCATGLTGCGLYQKIESFESSLLLGYAKSLQSILWQNSLYNASGSSLTSKIATWYPTATDNWTASIADLQPSNMQTIASGNSGLTTYSFTPSITAGHLGQGYMIKLDFGGSLNAGSGYIDIARCDLRAFAGLATGTVANPPLPQMQNANYETVSNLRYYYTLSPSMRTWPRTGTDTYRWFTYPFHVPMRAIPSCSGTYTVEGGGTGAASFETIGYDYATAFYNATNTTSVVNFSNFVANAEL